MLSGPIDNKTLPEDVKFIRFGSATKWAGAILPKGKIFVIGGPSAASLYVTQVIGIFFVVGFGERAREGLGKLEVSVVNSAEALFSGLFAHKVFGGRVSDEMANSVFEVLHR